jgi:hypothetical protein
LIRSYRTAAPLVQPEGAPGGRVHGFIASGLFAEPSDGLEKLLGRPATSMRDAVVAALG